MTLPFTHTTSLPESLETNFPFQVFPTSFGVGIPAPEGVGTGFRFPFFIPGGPRG